MEITLPRSKKSNNDAASHIPDSISALVKERHHLKRIEHYQAAIEKLHFLMARVINLERYQQHQNRTTP